MQVNISSFSEKRQGAFPKAGSFIRINKIIHVSNLPLVYKLCLSIL